MTPSPRGVGMHVVAYVLCLAVCAAAWAAMLRPWARTRAEAAAVTRVLSEVTFSFYPVVTSEAQTCVPPRVNILMLQAVATAVTALLGIPIHKWMLSWLLDPVYLFLDWRYASINGLPGCDTLLSYLARRGLLLLGVKVFFMGIPALVMMQSARAKQAAIYLICLPLLAWQCVLSGHRMFHGVDGASVWEVWMATVVAFGIGTDMGYVVEELRLQFSKVRMIADDCLPQHVVDTLMQQQQPSTLDSFSFGDGDEHVGGGADTDRASHRSMVSLPSPFASRTPMAPERSSKSSMAAAAAARVLLQLPASPAVPPQSGGGRAGVRRSRHSFIGFCGSSTPPPSLTAMPLSQPVSSSASYEAGEQPQQQQQQQGQGQGQGSSPTAAEAAELAAPWPLKIPRSSSLGRQKSRSAEQLFFLPAATRAAQTVTTAAAAAARTLASRPPSKRMSAAQRKPSMTADSDSIGPIAAAAGAATSSILRTGGAEYAEEHPDACVLFADVCDFTSISEGKPPGAVVAMLDTLFRKFDDLIADSPHLYKIDIIGDCYMVASGLIWHAGDPCPARTLTHFAKLMLLTAATVLDPVTCEPLRMRCGIHKGAVVGALLGCLRRKYSLFGDVVNSASRLESTSRPGAIHVSAEVYQQLRQYDRSSARGVHAPAGAAEPPGHGGGSRNGSDGGTGAGAVAGGDSAFVHAQSMETLFYSIEDDMLSNGCNLQARASSVNDDSLDNSVECVALLFQDLAGSPANGSLLGGPSGRTSTASTSLGRPSPSAYRSRKPLLLVGEQEVGLQQQQVLLPGAGKHVHQIGAERWQHRGQINLKGRAPLETFILQVL